MDKMPPFGYLILLSKCYIVIQCMGMSRDIALVLFGGLSDVEVFLNCSFYWDVYPQKLQTK